jgi:hypothetical protein
VINGRVAGALDACGESGEGTHALAPRLLSSTLFRDGRTCATAVGAHAAGAGERREGASQLLPSCAACLASTPLLLLLLLALVVLARWEACLLVLSALLARPLLTPTARLPLPAPPPPALPSWRMPRGEDERVGRGGRREVAGRWRAQRPAPAAPRVR